MLYAERYHQLRIDAQTLSVVTPLKSMEDMSNEGIKKIELRLTVPSKFSVLEAEVTIIAQDMQNLNTRILHSSPSSSPGHHVKKEYMHGCVSVDYTSNKSLLNNTVSSGPNARANWLYKYNFGKKAFNKTFLVEVPIQAQLLEIRVRNVLTKSRLPISTRTFLNTYRVSI